jgi:hypothetical protein
MVSGNTVKAYMGHLSDAYLFEKCRRYDVKRKEYFDYPNKYYCEDVSLRNACTGFRPQDMPHILENIIYNELRVRDCVVDMGVVYASERNPKGCRVQVAREINFLAKLGGKKLYIQSAYDLGTDTMMETKNKPLCLTGDFFPKIIVRQDIRKGWYDDNGILNLGILDFLLEDSWI